MTLGWGTFAGGIGKILDKLPIQGRKERWKNEYDNLSKERLTILRGQCDKKKINRIIYIDERLFYLNQLLRNSSDSN